MFAFALIALFALLGLASMAVIADSGLRWWSAFERLQTVSKAQPGQFAKAGMRPVVTSIAGAGRTAVAVSPTRRRAVRVAA